MDVAGPGGFEPSFSGLEVRCLILTWPRALTSEPAHIDIRVSEPYEALSAEEFRRETGPLPEPVLDP